ncbi:MAG: hypothetical protein MPI47_06425, partial [Cuniculiplasma sp.]|nr:hypothetical protein [Cuniculiplasma sp.]
MEVLNYWIKLEYDHKNKTYSGKEKIQLEGKEDRLILNTLEQKINKITLDGKNVELLEGRRDDEKIIEAKLNG